MNLNLNLNTKNGMCNAQEESFSRLTNNGVTVLDSGEDDIQRLKSE